MLVACCGGEGRGPHPGQQDEFSQEASSLSLIAKGAVQGRGLPVPSLLRPRQPVP